MSKERYIAAKQKWAEKQKAAGVTARAIASPDRLPPGQKLTTGFPVLDLGVQPVVPLEQWTLSVDGLVAKPAKLSWADFNALPQVDDVSDFHCVTTWSKYDCRWSGVAFTTLYELVQPAPEAKFVYFTGYDGYSTNVALEQCLDDDVLVATAFDGASAVISRETVQVERLNDLFDEFRSRRTFIKIDTQGFEPAVLAGAEKSLPHILGVQLELPIEHLYQNTWSFEDALRTMRHAGFVPAQIVPVPRACACET